VGANNVAGVFSSGDWFPDSTATGSADFVKAYVAKYGGAATDIDNSSAEAYAAGQVLELVAQRTGKVDNQTIIDSLHSGTWPTLLGDLSWDANGSPQGTYRLVQWINGVLKPVFPKDIAQADPIAPKPNWAG
jgi:branched-chain amino acid transport system substrate-binding protein